MSVHLPSERRSGRLWIGQAGGSIAKDGAPRALPGEIRSFSQLGQIKGCKVFSRTPIANSAWERKPLVTANR